MEAVGLLCIIMQSMYCTTLGSLNAQPHVAAVVALEADSRGSSSADEKEQKADRLYSSSCLPISCVHIPL